MINICWESRQHVERLTNKQLKLYLRQQTTKLSENRVLLIERVLNMHADGIFRCVNSVVRVFFTLIRNLDF